MAALVYATPPTNTTSLLRLICVFGPIKTWPPAHLLCELSEAARCDDDVDG